VTGRVGIVAATVVWLAAAGSAVPAGIEPGPAGDLRSRILDELERDGSENRPPVLAAPMPPMTAADVGRSYVVHLPRFVDPEGGRVTVTVEGETPPGLSVFWRPDGSVQISGIATVAGHFRFGLIARDRSGALIRVPLEIGVVAGDDNPIRFLPPEAPPPVEAAAGEGGPADPVAATAPDGAEAVLAGLVASFDGGPCFFARPLDAPAGSIHVEGFASTVDGFLGLEARILDAVSVEPRIDVRLVSRAQCPAVSFLAALDRRITARPLVTLDSYSVGGSVALSGRLSGPFEVAPALYLVADDGTVTRLDPELTMTADGATFRVPLQASGDSLGAPQVLLVVNAPAPGPAMEREPDAGDILADLRRAVAGAGGDAAVDAAVFRIVRR
jgi:hypothetical protein